MFDNVTRSVSKVALRLRNHGYVSLGITLVTGEGLMLLIKIKKVRNSWLNRLGSVILVRSGLGLVSGLVGLELAKQSVSPLIPVSCHICRIAK